MIIYKIIQNIRFKGNCYIVKSFLYVIINYNLLIKLLIYIYIILINLFLKEINIKKINNL